MVKQMLLATMFAIVSLMGYSQVRVEGNTYKSTTTTRTSKVDTTIYKWEDSKGNQYPICISQSGSCFVWRVSSKTGKQYRQYLGEEISKDICRKLGREYKQTKR